MSRPQVGGHMTRASIWAPVVGSVGLVVGLLGDLAGGVEGGPHDFSGGAYGGSGVDVCGACHVAHGTVTSQQTPLWDHELTTATHTLYASSTLDATPGQPQGISLICLSCHDGTVAVDSYGGTVGTTYIDPQFDLGTDLTNDHPISFVYDANLASADSGLHDPETTSSGIYGSIRTDLLYENSTMECGSCHNVHGTSPGLLRKDNSGSALCLTCHKK